MNNSLIVFLKYPEPGKVKTRLAKAIGNEKACAIYSRLAERVMKNIISKNPRTYDVHIFFTPADKENEIKDWLKPVLSNRPGANAQFILQEGNDLGERMSNAFQQILQGKYREGIITHRGFKQVTPPISTPSQGGDGGRVKTVPDRFRKEETVATHRNVIIIGTDCPGVDATLIENAFEVLKEKDIVIGPCKDGGYYLLGMSSPVPVNFEQGNVPDLFMNIDWSTNRVFKQTMEKIQKNNLSYSILKTLADIDTQEDLYRYVPDIL